MVRFIRDFDGRKTDVVGIQHDCPAIIILYTENADSSIYGVVLTADHKSRLCHVKWFSREGQELSVERDVSVYDITEHADFVFSAGDVVVRVAKNDNENEAAEQGAERPTPCVGQVGLKRLIRM